MPGATQAPFLQGAVGAMMALPGSPDRSSPMPGEEGNPVATPDAVLTPAARDALAYLEARDREGRTNNVPRSERLRAVDPTTARLMAWFIQSQGVRSVLEVGTSGGYSTIWLASAVRLRQGQVTTLEWDPVKVELARSMLARAGLAGFVTVLHGDARLLIPTLPGPFDAAFIDAEKEDYPTYLDLIFPRLAPGGLLLADNVLSHADELRPYLDAVRRHPGLQTVTLPVGRGLEVSCKLPA